MLFLCVVKKLLIYDRTQQGEAKGIKYWFIERYVSVITVLREMNDGKECDKSLVEIYDVSKLLRQVYNKSVDSSLWTDGKRKQPSSS